MSLRDAALAIETALLVAAMTLSACASQRDIGSSAPPTRADQKVAILHIRGGEDRQAEIVSFDGVPFAAFVGRHARPGHFRVPLRPGVHDVSVVRPGPCTYYDGTPGPGSSRLNLRFTARARAQYEVTLVFFPSQLLTLTEVHVYEVLKRPGHVRSVEQVTSNEPVPSSCPHRQGMVR
jgi:hypothetical protein